jgi:serine/threonine protein phosphatase 1
MRYAISDIHGCLKTFTKLLETIEFSKDDTLYILGDMIDRGPSSFQVVDKIINMKNEGYDVNVLLGNHEEFMIKSVDNTYVKQLWHSNGAHETLASYSALANGYTDTIKWYDKIPSSHWEFILNLPLKIELEDYVLVHAGLDFQLNNPLESTSDDMLWIRIQGLHPELKKTIGNRTLISGHTARTINEINEAINQDYAQIIIDNGCYYKYYEGYEGLGNLCCFNLDTKELQFQNNIDIKRKHPLDW